MVAVEVNVSCPNVEDRARMFAHSESATCEALSATECGLPRWAKLSPNVPDIAAIAGAALDGGAEGLTLTNTLLGLALDIETGRPVLGAGGGGLSGAVLRPVAVRAVWECRAAFPGTPIIGVGGVRSGRDAVEFLRAGADAVQVGTAIFRDPRRRGRCCASSVDGAQCGGRPSLRYGRRPGPAGPRRPVRKRPVTRRRSDAVTQ